jgi:DNA-binding CsgD family transcriptional regulator
VSDPSLGLDVDVRALQTLHGLTFVEARLALGIASGKTIAEMAERLEVSLNTARWYAREVRQKLDVHRQEDIVRVVARSVAALAVRLHASGSEQTKV